MRWPPGSTPSTACWTRPRRARLSLDAFDARARGLPGRASATDRARPRRRLYARQAARMVITAVTARLRSRGERAAGAAGAARARRPTERARLLERRDRRRGASSASASGETGRARRSTKLERCRTRSRELPPARCRPRRVDRLRFEARQRRRRSRRRGRRLPRRARRAGEALRDAARAAQHYVLVRKLLGSTPRATGAEGARGRRSTSRTSSCSRATCSSTARRPRARYRGRFAT